MRRFYFYISGIDNPYEFIRGFNATTRKKAFDKAYARYGQYATYSPSPTTPRKKKKTKRKVYVYGLEMLDLLMTSDEAAKAWKRGIRDPKYYRRFLKKHSK